MNDWRLRMDECGFSICETLGGGQAQCSIPRAALPFDLLWRDKSAAGPKSNRGVKLPPHRKHLMRRAHVAGRSPRCRYVTLERIIHHHAVGIKSPSEGANGALHTLDPAVRQAVAVPLVVKGNNLFLQDAIQILAIAELVASGDSVASHRVPRQGAFSRIAGPAKWRALPLRERSRASRRPVARSRERSHGAKKES